VLDLSNGSLIWKLAFDSPFFSQPTIVDDCIYFAESNRTIHAFQFPKK